MDERDFGRRLRTLRHDRAETLEVVSASTGLSVAMLSRVERGERLPSPESVEVLAAHFGLPADVLMSETIASKMVNRYGREQSHQAAARMQDDRGDTDAQGFATDCAHPPLSSEEPQVLADSGRRSASEHAGASFAPASAPRSFSGSQSPMRAAGAVFSVQPIEALFDEDMGRDSLADAAHVAEVALESAMRAVRRAQASGNPDQIEQAEIVLERLRRALR